MRVKLILLSMLMSSCSYLSAPVLSPYKMDIRQGNYVTPEMRDKLKIGMSKQQVRFVLGTPMINDAFHGNRWDYVYRLESRGKVVEKQQLTVYFDGDNLVRIDDEGRPVKVESVIAQQPDKPVMPEPVAAPVVVPVIAEVSQPQPVAELPQPQLAVETLQPLPVAEVPRPIAKSDDAADVLKSVQDWVAAWSARDVAKYLASYADTFKPSGMGKAAWEAQRRERVGKAKSIVVEVGELDIKLRDENHASVVFKQDYRSDSYKDSVRKTLQLEKIGGAWLIVSEQVNKK